MKNFKNFRILTLTLCCLFSIYTYGQKTERPEYVPRQVLVKMKANRTATQKNALKTQMKARLHRTSPHSNVEVWNIDQSKGNIDIQQLINSYCDHPDIEYIEPNYYYYLATEDCPEKGSVVQESTPCTSSEEGHMNLPLWRGQGGGLLENCENQSLGNKTLDSQKRWVSTHRASQAFNTNPNDALYPDQWNLNNTGQNSIGTPDADIDAPEAWDIATGSPSIVVGLIDTGIDWKHPDLINNIWQNLGEDADGDGQVIEWNGSTWIFDPGDINGIDDDGNTYADDFIGWDFINNDNDPFDSPGFLSSGHGTHVAGTLGAEGNNGIGVAGVTWDVQIAALRVFAGQNTSVSVIAEALDYAVMMDMPITNNSYAEGQYANRMIEALDSVQANGHLFIAAAGNFRNDNDIDPNYPSSYPFDNIISVAATDRNDLLWMQSAFRGSSFGATNVDIAAPGRTILSTLPFNAYGDNTGTSMATPHVSGACALLWEQYPDKTYGEIKTAVLSSVDSLPDLVGRCASEGRLNLYGALTYFDGDTTTISLSCRERDSLALVALYEATDGANWLDTWDLSQPMDGWYGVGVNQNGCVTCLDLDGNLDCSYVGNTGNNLIGNIPPELGDLTYLTYLGLSFNQLSGNIPPELGNLTNVIGFNLSHNPLTGTIPPELGNLINVVTFAVNSCQLSGNIPPTFGNLINPYELNFHTNNLTGNIPPEFGDLNNLSILRIYNNQLSGCYGENLINLCSSLIPPWNTNIYISNGNNFDTPWQDFCSTGVGTCSAYSACRQSDSLVLVDFYNSTYGSPFWDLNQPMNSWSGVTLNTSGCVVELNFWAHVLWGSLPPELGNLSNLTVLNLNNNVLEGSIPPELGNLSNLENLDLGNNGGFNGNIPPELGNLNKLNYLHLGNNQLSGNIPSELGNLSNLTALTLFGNQLTGSIPSELDNLSNLTALDLSGNQLTGSIPPELGNLSNLTALSLSSNQLTGSIPPELGNLNNLTALDLSSNQLISSIPSELGDLNNLTALRLDNNQLTGSIPLGIGNLNGLYGLYLNNNQLSGCYDGNLINLFNVGTNLSVSDGNNFDASWEDFRYSGIGACNNPYLNCRYNDSLILVALYNSTNGANWGNIWVLDQPINTWYGVTLNGFGCVASLHLSYNELSGSIPPEIGNLNNLINLRLSGNELSGSIPPDLGNLSKLWDLRLSYNELSGSIPPEIGNLNNLNYLYLYNNQLSNCYAENLTGLCSQLSSFYGTNTFISNGNNLDVPWRDFCNTGAGTCALVWPGDYNYDGIANETDALYWGLAYGNTGDTRPDSIIAWQGQQAPDWSAVVQDVNGKHQDGDGNGLIDGADLQVVNDNFGNIHAYNQSVYIASTLVYNLVEAGPVSGDPSYDLYVRTADGDTISAHGLAAVIDFGDLNVDEVKLRINNSSLTPSDTLNLLDTIENRLHLALTRTDGVNQLCDGPVANFIIVTEDIPTGDSLKFDIETGNVVQANGDMATIAEMSVYSNYPSGIANNNLIISASVIHEQCNISGSVELSVEGGESPYSYSWNTGETTSSITGLTPNIYTVTITDDKDSTQILSVEVQGEYISIPDEFGNLPECTNSPCPTLLTPSGTVSTNTYKAGRTVSSDGEMDGSVQFKAGETIMLQPGFKVPPNKEFSGIIEDCEN